MAALRATFTTPPSSVEDPDSREAVRQVLEIHQLRALHVQAALRAVLALAAAVQMMVFKPPRQAEEASYALMSCYVVWSLVVLYAVWQRPDPTRKLAWAVPFIDLPALVGILIVSGSYSDPNWESPFAADGLILICVLAAFQLEPRITAVTGVLATVSFGLASGIGHLHASPDLHFTLARTAIIALVSVAAVLLSRIQKSRTQTIANLAQHRSWLLAHTMSTIEVQRRYLAEALHDGPLQSVLVARQDIDEAACDQPHEALARADEALRDASRSLRSSVTNLHPAVLERAGLEQALRDLAADLAQRGRFEVEAAFETSSAGHDADRLLFHCGRELLTNIVKHARAKRVQLAFAVHYGQAWLTIADDGVGMDPGVLQQRVAEGHIGLASQRIRVEEAGGSMTLRSNHPTGTVVTIMVPTGGDG